MVRLSQGVIGIVNIEFQEPQSVSARWRALAWKQFRLLDPVENGASYWAKQATIHIKHILRGCLACDKYPDLRDMIVVWEGRIAEFWRSRVIKFINVTREAMLSWDHEPVMIAHGARFNAETMEDDGGGGRKARKSVKGTVFCTRTFGLQAFASNQESSSNKRLDPKVKLIIKPVVILKAEADRMYA